MTTSEDRKQIFGRQASFPAGAAEFLLMGVRPVIKLIFLHVDVQVVPVPFVENGV